MSSTAGNEHARAIDARAIWTQVCEGMVVYDRDNHRVGTIRRVQFADRNDPVDLREERLDARDKDRPADQATGTGWSLIETFRDALVPEGSIPGEAREWLRREGFIEIAGDWHHPPRYAAMRQIDRVADGDVILGIASGDLVRG